MESALLTRVQQKRRTFVSAWKTRYHVFDAASCVLKTYSSENKSELLGEQEVVGLVDEPADLLNARSMVKGKLGRIGTTSKHSNRFDLLVAISDEPFALAAGWCLFLAFCEVNA